MSDKQAHLQMIQEIIKRMANNSFLIKGWSVLLVSAILAVAFKEQQILFLLVAALPALVLWGLDGYFLREERLFRKLYNHVTTIDDEEIDFSMNYSDFSNNVPSWFTVALSWTLLAFHGAILSSIAIITGMVCLLK